MAQHWLDLAAQTLGADPPAGITKYRYGVAAAVQYFRVAQTADAVPVRYIEGRHDEGFPNYGHSWDTPGQLGRIPTTVQVEFSADAVSTGSAGVHARLWLLLGTANDGNPGGMALRWHDGNLRIERRANNIATVATGILPVVGKRYRLTYSVAWGADTIPTFTAKLENLTDAVTLGNLSHRDSTYYSAADGGYLSGYTGLAQGGSGNLARFWSLAVGTNGDAAPAGPVVSNSRPAAPTLTVANVTRTSADGTLSPPSDPDGDSITDTEVRVRTSGGAVAYGPVGLGPAPVWPHPATGLPEGTPDLRWEGRYSDAGGWGDWGVSAPFSTAENQPPSTPSITSHIDGDVISGVVELGGTAVPDPEGDAVTYPWRFTPAEGGAAVQFDAGDATPAASWDSAAAGLADGAQIDLQLGAADPFDTSWSAPVRVTYQALLTPNDTPPRAPYISGVSLLGGGGVRIQGGAYSSPINAPQARRRWWISKAGVVIVNEWRTNLLSYYDLEDYDPTTAYVVAIADADISGAESALGESFSFPVSQYADWSEYAEEDWHTRLDTDGPGYTLGTATVRPRHGAIGGLVLELNANSTLTAGVLDRHNGNSGHFWLALGAGRPGLDLYFDTAHKWAAGESGGLLAGLRLCVTRSGDRHDGGYAIAVSPHQILAYSLLDSPNGFVTLMQGSAPCSIIDSELYILRVFPTVEMMERSYYGIDGLFYPGDPSRLFPFLRVQVSVIRDRTGDIVGSLDFTFRPGGTVDEEDLPLPVSGYSGPLHVHHEGRTHVVRFGGFTFAPAATPLPTPRILWPSFGTPCAGAVGLEIEQPAAYLDATIEFRGFLLAGEVESVLFAAQTIAPDAEGRRVLELPITVPEGTDYRVRVESRYAGGVWNVGATSHRFIVDLSGGSAVTRMQAATLSLLWGQVGGFSLGGAPAAEDGAALLQALNSTGAVAWVEGGTRGEGMAFGRVRLSAIQVNGGVVIRGSSPGGGSGDRVVLDHRRGMALLVRRLNGVDVVLLEAVVAVVLGAYYILAIKYGGGLLSGIVFRDDDTFAEAVLLAAPVAVGATAGLVGVQVGGGTGDGVRLEEVDVLGFSDLCEAPSVAAVEITSVSADLAVSPDL